MWRRIIDMTRRSGHPVVFLSPNIPSELRGAAGYLLLDCDDDVLAERLRARGWNATQVESTLRDARAYRPLFGTVARTDDTGPDGVAKRILAWMDSLDEAAASGPT